MTGLGRRILGLLLALFIAVPLLEVLLLVAIGRRLGLWPTVAVVVVAGALGAVLARAEGLRVLGAIRRDLARGEVPAAGLLDGMLVLLAGALLIAPGLITDIVAIALLVPPVRRLVRLHLARAVRRWLGR